MNAKSAPHRKGITLGILVTGASGHLGQLVVSQLIAKGTSPSDIVAGARDVAKLDGVWDGVGVARMDYDDAKSVTAAFDGVDRVLLISGSDLPNREVQHRRVIDAAVAADVDLFAYTSMTRADEKPPVSIAPSHLATEKAIAETDLPAVLLRNNLYTENYAQDIAVARATGVLAANAGTGRIASASRIDFAEAAAVVLTQDGHAGQTYELGGDVSWDYNDLAAEISQVIGKPVSYEPLTDDEFANRLKGAGLDEAVIAILSGLNTGVAAGAFDSTSRTLSQLIGRPTTPLAEGLQAILRSQ